MSVTETKSEGSFSLFLNAGTECNRRYINNSRHLARKHARIFVQGQISEHIFALNGGCCLYYPSNLFRNARNFQNWGIFYNYSMSARWIWDVIVDTTKFSPILIGLNWWRGAIVLIRGGPLSAHSARPLKIPGWIVPVRRKYPDG